MSLLEILKSSPDQLADKVVHQLIAFAGSGKLLDDSDCSDDFRAFLANVSTARLADYAEQCLKQPFPDSGLALQDIVNELGSRIGANVVPGRYRGTSAHSGQDGLWKFPTGHAIVVEVKTTDAYRIDLNVIAKYRRTLVSEGAITEALSSMLLIVGRQETGELEAQIRGSRFAWDVRIISVGALIRLLALKEEVEDPTIVQRIHNILIPREFTRLDAIADILFSAAEDIKQEEDSSHPMVDAELGLEVPKATPMAFNDACVQRIQFKLGTALMRRSRVSYESPDKRMGITCSVSKEHDSKSNPNYWFAFHPHQREFLAKHEQAYAAFGCGTSEMVFLIPYAEFETWLQEAGTTETDGRMYWHILIYKKDGHFTLRRRRGSNPIDLEKYKL